MPKPAQMNLKWTLADINRIEEMARRRRYLSDIADRFDVGAAEMRALLERNEIYWWRPDPK